MTDLLANLSPAERSAWRLRWTVAAGAATLSLSVVACAIGAPALPPDPPLAPVTDPAVCAASCARAQSACPAPTSIDDCVSACQQVAPDLEGPIDELTVALTCPKEPSK